jgi:lysine 6-dehydrogenase
MRGLWIPYWLNPAITRVAIRSRASMCDLGGKTDLVLEQLELDEAAAKAGIAVVPDCGQVPGMGTSLMVYAMSLLDRTDHVFMWDGGNDQHPRPPFNYISTFHIAGLTNEHTARPSSSERKVTRAHVPARGLRGGRRADWEDGGFRNRRRITALLTFEGKLQTYRTRPALERHYSGRPDGHGLTTRSRSCQRRAAGRGTLHTCVDPRSRPARGPRLRHPDQAIGEKDGRPAEATVELFDSFDEATGFSAMERTTGWDGAIVAIMNAHGVTPRGVKPVEIAVPVAPFVAELRRRGVSRSLNGWIFTEAAHSFSFPRVPAVPEKRGSGLGARLLTVTLRRNRQGATNARNDARMNREDAKTAKSAKKNTWKVRLCPARDPLVRVVDSARNRHPRTAPH